MLTVRSRGEESGYIFLKSQTIYHLPPSSSSLSESVILFDSEFDFEVFGLMTESLCDKGQTNFKGKEEVPQLFLEIITGILFLFQVHLIIVFSYFWYFLCSWKA